MSLHLKYLVCWERSGHSLNVALIRTFVKENIPCVKYMRYIFFAYFSSPIMK